MMSRVPVSIYSLWFLLGLFGHILDSMSISVHVPNILDIDFANDIYFYVLET